MQDLTLEPWAIHVQTLTTILPYWKYQQCWLTWSWLSFPLRLSSQFLSLLFSIHDGVSKHSPPPPSNMHSTSLLKSDISSRFLKVPFYTHSPCQCFYYRNSHLIWSSTSFSSYTNYPVFTLQKPVPLTLPLPFPSPPFVSIWGHTVSSPLSRATDVSNTPYRLP